LQSVEEGGGEARLGRDACRDARNGGGKFTDVRSWGEKKGVGELFHGHYQKKGEKPSGVGFKLPGGGSPASTDRKEETTVKLSPKGKNKEGRKESPHPAGRGNSKNAPDPFRRKERRRIAGIISLNNKKKERRSLSHLKEKRRGRGGQQLKKTLMTPGCVFA